MKIKVKIKKLDSKAQIPQYAKEGDACVDLIATSVKTVDEGDYGYMEYGTSLAMEIPKGYVGRIVPRSSISNTGMILANSPGTIDSGYRGEIKVRFKVIPRTKIYEVGDKIAQLSIEEVPEIEFEEIEELETTERGKEGFGSTGN